MLPSHYNDTRYVKNVSYKMFIHNFCSPIARRYESSRNNTSTWTLLQSHLVTEEGQYAAM
jgi:hypothetical protein